MSGITNVDVGQAFGVSHAAVSRWRSGSRLPSLAAQVAIRRVLGWSVDDQADAILSGPEAWAAEFEQRLGANRLLIRQEIARNG